MTFVYAVIGTVFTVAGLFYAWTGLNGLWGSWWDAGICAIMFFVGGTILWATISLMLGRMTPKEAKQLLSGLISTPWF